MGFEEGCRLKRVKVFRDYDVVYLTEEINEWAEVNKFEILHMEVESVGCEFYIFVLYSDSHRLFRF